MCSAVEPCLSLPWQSRRCRNPRAFRSVGRLSFGDILITDRFFVSDQVSGIKLLVFCIQMRFLPEQKYLHLEVDCVEQRATVVIILC